MKTKIFHRRSIRILVYYLLAFVLWVGLSGLFLTFFVDDHQQFVQWHSYSGAVFVILTAVFLSLMVERELRAKESAHEALHYSQESFRYLFANNPQPMWVYDPKTLRYLDSNQAAVRQYGYSMDEMLSMSVTDLQHPEDVPGLLDLVSKPRPAAQLASVWRHRRKDGSTFHVRITSHTITYAGQEAMLVVGEDITEQQETAHALRSVQERSKSLENIINLSPAVVFQWEATEDWRVSYVSENVRQFGYTPEAFYTRPEAFVEFVHPQDRQQTFHSVTAFVLSGIDRFIQEYRVLTAGKEERWVECRMSIRRDAAGQALHYQGVLLDVTERKQAEREKEDALYSLQERLKELTLLHDTARLLHQIDRPLPEILQAICDRIPHAFRFPGITAVTLRFGEEVVETPNFIETPWSIHTGFGSSDGRRGEIRVYYLQEVDANPTNPFFEEEQRLVDSIADMLRTFIERKIIRTNLVNSERRLQDLVEFLPDATFAIDREGRVILWNRAMEELTGVCEADMLGKGDNEYALPFFDHRRPVLADMVLHPEISIDDYYTDWERSDGHLNIEAPIPSFKGGAIVWATAAPLYDGDGNVVGAVETIRDVTERKRSEEALRLAHQRLRYHVENTPLALVEWDSNFNIAHWSRRAEALLGWSEAEVLGHSNAELGLTHPDDEVGVTEMTRQMACGELFQKINANRNIAKDGSVVYMEWYNSALLDSTGKLQSILCLAHDVTDRVQAEESIRQLNNQLEQRVVERTRQLELANKELEAFSYSVSHDLRAPLRHIDGYSQALLEDCSEQMDSLGRGYIQRIR
ncbi:MAG: PAS domain S-box protein, partial [Anaerolineaceae bacterium]|nr:PAS domain S-box protein [Anaerolineaceae bacterium]